MGDEQSPMRERNPDHPTNAYAISRRVKRRRGSSPAANEKDLEGLNTFPLSGFLIHSFDITPGICAPLKHGREFPGPVAILASRQLPLDVSADSNIRINPFRRSFVCVYKNGGAEKGQKTYEAYSRFLKGNECVRQPR